MSLARQMLRDHVYLEMAAVQARLSKDPSSRVGAVVLDRGGIVKGTGYNGFARGVQDSLSRLRDREVKLLLTRHAERNALWAAGPAASHGTLYVTHPPCASCASDIAQHGIARLVYPRPDQEFAVRWATDLKWSVIVLREAGVEVVELDVTIQ